MKWLSERVPEEEQGGSPHGAAPDAKPGDTNLPGIRREDMNAVFALVSTALAWIVHPRCRGRRNGESH